MTTPLFLLRCVQLGISIRDLDLLTVGLVNDMYIESDNDNENYAQVATQRRQSTHLLLSRMMGVRSSIS